MSCHETVASNEDNAIELTLYRKNGVRSGSQRPNPDLRAQVELGDMPPVTREVISIRKNLLTEHLLTYLSSYKN